AVVRDVGFDLRVTHLDDPDDESGHLWIVVDDQHATRAAAAARGGAAAAGELLDVTHQKAAMAAGGGQRAEQAARGPLPHGYRVHHQQLSNLVGREMRLLL